jgi:hypothetical protein
MEILACINGWTDVDMGRIFKIVIVIVAALFLYLQTLPPYLYPRVFLQFSDFFPVLYLKPLLWEYNPEEMRYHFRWEFYITVVVLTAVLVCALIIWDKKREEKESKRHVPDSGGL